MPSINVNGKTIELNEEGFLVRQDEWGADVAEAIARQEEAIEILTDDHWAVVNFIRQYYLDNSLAPMVRKVCKATGFQLKHIYELFPSGPAKGACKVAGLPKPDGCV